MFPADGAFDNLVNRKKKTGCTISFVQEYSVSNFTSTEVEIHVSILFLLSALINKLVQQALNLFISVEIKDSTQTAGYDKETTCPIGVTPYLIKPRFIMFLYLSCTIKAYHHVSIILL